MSVIIGSARIDEHGNAHGGSAGDQRQTSKPDYKGEVSMQDFYNHSKGWIVARPKDAKQAEQMANSMETACNNPNIGYDQYQRDGVWSHGTDSKVKTETDCSALVRRCIFEATGKDVGNIRTITMHEALPKSGLFKPLFDYKSGMDLYTGDILFTGHLGHPVSGHTVIVVKGKKRTDDGDNDKPTLDIAQPVLKAGMVNREVKVLQKNLNLAKCRDENGNKLEKDGEFGKHTLAALKNFQAEYGLVVDGIYGARSAAKMNEVLNG